MVLKEAISDPETPYPPSLAYYVTPHPTPITTSFGYIIRNCEFVEHPYKILRGMLFELFFCI